MRRNFLQTQSKGEGRMTMRKWEVRYKLQQQGKYFFRTVEAVYQYEANKIFDAEMPNAIRCGSARSL